MFHPTSVASHKMRLSYSEENRNVLPTPRNNHGSLPSFKHSYDDLSAAIIGDAAASKATMEEKISTLQDLPTVETPPSLPGDCNVKDYVLENVTSYDGDDSFLAPATERTLKSWARCEELMELERQKGILDVDTKTVSTIVSHGPGYVLSKEEDVIAGLQTDAPLKRSCKPKGGFSVVRKALESYGYKADPDMAKTYTQVSSIYCEIE